MCDRMYCTTRMPHRSDTSAIQATRVWHVWDTSGTRLLHERPKYDTSENFDFDNDTSENIFSQPYINYMAIERLQGEEQFYSKNYLLEIPLSHAKISLKSAPQKLNFLMVKAISKSYTLDCSWKCPYTFSHSYV